MTRRPDATAAAGLRSRQRWIANGFTLLCLFAWWAAAQMLPPYLVASPVDVAWRAVQFFTDGFDRYHLIVTCLHVASGVALALALGSGLALCAHFLPVTRLMIRHRWYPFLNSFSGIGWAIVAVLWFGPSHMTVLFAMTAVLIPFVFINVSEGLAAADAELSEMARSFSRSTARNFLHVGLPALYPFLFAALRISVGVAWKSALLIELFGTNEGLGFVVNQARQNYESATIMAIIALIIAFVYAMDTWALSPLHRRLARHYED